jgi:hypothetical protein
MGVPAVVPAEPCSRSVRAFVPPSCGGVVLGVVGHPEPVRALTPPGPLVLAGLPRQTLVVETVVDLEGRAHLERVLRGPCDEATEAAVRAALEGARWLPARRDGQPVCTHFALTLRANGG